VVPHIPVVIQRLCDKDEQTCFAASNVLCSLSSSAVTPHAATLMEQFETVPGSSRWRLVELFGKFDAAMLSEHVDAITKLMGHVDADVRRRAVEMLGALPDLPAHVAAALPYLEDEDEDCRLSAVEVFGKLPPPALEAHTPAMLARLSDEEECIRMGAVVVLGRLPTAALEPHTATLLARLDDSSWRVRRHTMEVTATLPAAVLAPHVELILRHLEHTDARVREWAVGAFSHLSAALEPSTAGMVAPRVAKALEARMQDEDRRVRERATSLRSRISAS